MEEDLFKYGYYTVLYIDDSYLDIVNTMRNKRKVNFLCEDENIENCRKKINLAKIGKNNYFKKNENDIKK